MMTRLLAVAVLSLTCLAAWAQLRTIPKDAKRGEMRHVQEMAVEVDGRRLQLAPGAQIRDADNRVVVPTAVPRRALVKYRLDANGMIREAWILSPQEAAQRDKR
jgi:hypothetical protein